MILQEILMEQDPTGWRMLVGCQLLNLTRRAQVDGVYPKLFEDYPTPRRMADAHVFRLEHDLMSLGLHHRRAMTLHRFCTWWVMQWDSSGLRDEARLGQVTFPAEFLEQVRAMEPPGVGEYARDSWVMFVEGRVPDWPVHDHALLAWLREHDPGLGGRPWDARVA